MRLVTLALLGWALTCAGSSRPSAQAPAPPAATAHPYSQLVTQYCVACHNRRLSSGGLVLDQARADQPALDPITWERVIRKVQTGAMPPQGARRPDDATMRGFVTWLQSELDRNVEAHPNPGRPLLRRLNRSEYANAVRDLLGLDVDVTALLPADDAAYGFDNIADALGVSPVLLERYLSAAGRISELAIGDTTAGSLAQTYRIRQDLSQDQWLEGLPFGTVGGLKVTHDFPLDGVYEFRVTLFRTNTDATRGLEYPRDLEISVDGERIFLNTVGGGEDFRLLFEDPITGSNAVDARLRVRVPVKAGSRSVVATFLQKSLALDTRRLQPYLRSSADTFDFTGHPHIQNLTISGPLGESKVGDTPVRRRVFVCRPETVAEEEPCATRIVTALARRAYRRPVTSDDLRSFLAFYRDGRKYGSFDSGIQFALERILSSPAFVFRPESEPASVTPGAPYKVNGYELASRLSFYLWSSIPDEILLDAAGRGELSTDAGLDRQVRRMLADPRSEALIHNFGGQWLQLRNLRSFQPNSNEFPDFDDNLRQALDREVILFFTSILEEDRSALDFLRADYTFVNERLARHYGLPNVSGSRFRRVTLTDDARRGLLGKGAVLAVTSHADRTSPVLRGKWILENIMGTPPAPPPPDVPSLSPNEGAAPKTMRERMVVHRANAVCANCHKVMDPLGLSMENFNAVGAWRDREAGKPIDATGQLVDGSKIDGVVQLRDALLARPEMFVTSLTEKLMIYALGRGLEPYDMTAVRKIVREAAAGDYKLTSLIAGVARSYPFQMRLRSSPGDESEGRQAARTQ